ncbi:MAG: heparinase II/III family protein [Thermodesulfobacteriota bacterium]
MSWASRKLRQYVDRWSDQRRTSYCDDVPGLALKSLFQRMASVPPPSRTVLDHWLDHRFDLLGSGWVRVVHGMKCGGLEGYRYHESEPPSIDSDGRWLENRINRGNLPETQRIWRLLDRDYVPMDWQLDFKSGYRWNERTWYRDFRISHLAGVDIKVPWELARMQHLPRMALGYLNSARLGEPRKELVREFRNQVLDFVATNPPRFGVNWACTMDVAIRVANWLLAYDLFRNAGADFDEPVSPRAVTTKHESHRPTSREPAEWSAPPDVSRVFGRGSGRQPFCTGTSPGELSDKGFERVFRRSVYEHGRHIVGNLEWFHGIRGNHYLADIAGLLFVAAHLERTRETDAWLAFAVQELIEEVGYQFHRDGTNFEGSTAYHRLSAEMVAYCTALVLGLPPEKQEALRTYDPRVVRGRPRLRPAPLPWYDVPGNDASCCVKTPFPPWYFDRIERMGEFIADITKPDGHIPQIGDNDSGRFFKLAPVYESMTVKDARKRYPSLSGYDGLPDDAEYLMEDHLDCRHLVAAVCGLVDRPDLLSRIGDPPGRGGVHPDTACVEAFAQGLRASSHRTGTAAWTVDPAAYSHPEQFRDDRTTRDPGCNNATMEPPRRRSWPADTTRGKNPPPPHQEPAEWSELSNTLRVLGRGSGGQPFCKRVSPGRSSSERSRVTRFEAGHGDLREGVRCVAYPDFGLYLLKSHRLYLSLRCWSGEYREPGGHFHNDQLSIELTIDGKDLVMDPGTYLYTPVPEARNKYRSVDAHFTPWAFDREPASLREHLFKLPDPPKAEIRYFGSRGIVATLLTRPLASRTCLVTREGVTIVDRVFGAEPCRWRPTHPECPISPGYGLRVNHANLLISPAVRPCSRGDL